MQSLFQLATNILAQNVFTVYTNVQVEFLGDDFKVKFLGSAYT